MPQDQAADSLVTETGEHMRAKTLKHLLRVVDPEEYDHDLAHGVADRGVEEASLTDWHASLKGVAAEHGMREDDPVVFRALQLVNDRRSGRQPDWAVEGGAVLAAEDEAGAQLIASRAPAVLEARQGEMQAKMDAEMRALDITPMSSANRGLESASPESWHLVLCSLATDELGIPYDQVKTHPAVSRAMHLTGASALSTTDELTMGLAAERQLPGVEPGPAPLPGPIGVQRSNPPFGLRQHSFRVTHLGGHPGVAAGRRGLLLVFSSYQASLFDERHGSEEATLEWGKVESLHIEGSNTVEQRVTIPRLVGGGIFAFAKKKREKRAYLVFGTGVGEVIVEVQGAAPMELRGALSPLLNWLN